MKAYRSITKPIREKPSFDERWNGEDKGLIIAWEVGREKAINNPDLAIACINDQLPKLGWDGGHEKQLQKRTKYGSLLYLAQWQGLRGEDLDVDAMRDDRKELFCNKTKMTTIFTTNMQHFKE